jgi:hypothetical protein
MIQDYYYKPESELWVRAMGQSYDIRFSCELWVRVTNYDIFFSRELELRL